MHQLYVCVCACVCVCGLAGVKTIALMILIIFEVVGIALNSMGKYQKKIELCIIMHQYAKYVFFSKWLKTTFLGISDDFKDFLFCSPNIFLGFRKFTATL